MVLLHWFCRDTNKRLPTDKQLILTDGKQSKDTTRVHPEKPMTFIDGAYRNMGEGLLNLSEPQCPCMSNYSFAED